MRPIWTTTTKSEISRSAFKYIVTIRHMCVAHLGRVGELWAERFDEWGWWARAASVIYVPFADKLSERTYFWIAGTIVHLTMWTRFKRCCCDSEFFGDLNVNRRKYCYICDRFCVRLSAMWCDCLIREDDRGIWGNWHWSGYYLHGTQI